MDKVHFGQAYTGLKDARPRFSTLREGAYCEYAIKTAASKTPDLLL
jgi:hypothetical protein